MKTISRGKRMVWVAGVPRFPDMKVMIMRSDDDNYWDVYYKKTGYAYEFAFGLSETIDTSFVIAFANAADYRDLFT